VKETSGSESPPSVDDDSSAAGNAPSSIHACDADDADDDARLIDDASMRPLPLPL